ncbi:MAG: DUF924 domain-containing protein [Rhodospirillales bacterium]|nr:DUF924 domain-containing protein [Rhodospirillales bacterium]
MPANQIVRSVVDFWFGAPDSEGYGKFRPEWFKVDAAFDAEIRRRFLHIWRTAAAGELGFLSESPEGCLALVLILDQFPRNMFRGTPEAFATDPHACRIADQALEKGFDDALLPVQRIFIYLPFEHAEDLALQERCVDLMAALGDDLALDYAVRHRDIIARFGRFPHRNAILGRPSTPEEIEFLKQPNSSF